MLTVISALFLTSAHALPLYDMAGSANQNQPDHCKVDHQGGKGGSSPWDSFGQFVDQEVYVYVSKDFALNFNTYATQRCATNPNCTDPQTITQDQGRNIVINAMEVWNRESRGPALIYAGETDFGLEDRHELKGGSCADFLASGAPGGKPLQRPAVIVDAVNITNAAGGVMPLKTASGDWCYGKVPDFKGVVSLDVGNVNVQGIRPTMIHEFGHVLGLAHSWGDFYDGAHSLTNDRYDGPPSVMLYDINEYNAATPNFYSSNHQWRGHLFPYDVDCVDDDMSAPTREEQQDGRRRALEYAWWTYKPADNSWSELQTDGWRTTSKSFSGGMMQPTAAEGGDVVSLFYADPWFDETFATWLSPKDFETGRYANGTMDLDFHSATFAEDSLNPYRPLDSWIAPSVFALYNETDDSDSLDWMIAFPQTLRGGDRSDAAIDAADPPLWMVQGGKRPGDDTHAHGEHYPFEVLSEPWVGKIQVDELRTHVSPRFAWDPVSEQTIAATVITRDCRGRLETFNFTTPTLQDRCGGIRVYSHALSDTLLLPETLTIGRGQSFEEVPDYSIVDPAGGTMAQGYTSLEVHSYTATTDVAPAVACAPAPTGIADTVSNCLLAWVDNGTPDGHILTAYFSVTALGIEWGPEIQVLRPTATVHRDKDAVQTGPEYVVLPSPPAHSQSDLSAIYSDGRFFLALKTSGADSTGSVAMVQTEPGDLDEWDLQTIWTQSQTIEAPIFLHDPTDASREWSLVWNMTDWGI